MLDLVCAQYAVCNNKCWIIISKYIIHTFYVDYILLLLHIVSILEFNYSNVEIAEYTFYVS